GAALIGREGRDPQVVGGEGGAASDARAGVGQQRRRRARQQLVRGGLSDGVALRAVDDAPGPAARGVDVAPGGQLRLEQGRRGLEGVAHGFSPLPGLPVGSASTWITALSVPSISMSIRTLKRCWWNGAARPGATILACGPASPFATAIVDMIPVSLTSSCMVPSR